MDRSIVLADELGDKLINGTRDAREVLEVLCANKSILEFCVNRWLQTQKIEPIKILEEAKKQMIIENLEYIYNEL